MYDLEEGRPRFPGGIADTVDVSGFGTIVRDSHCSTPVTSKERLMKASLAGFVIVLGLLSTEKDASAQQPCAACAATPAYGTAPFSGAVYTGETVVSGDVLINTPVGSAAPVVMSYGSQPRVLPYSYYAAFPNPARVYVGYGGADQFPFQGRAYGHPGDRWSWYYMGGGDSRYLAKYYYQLLR